MNISQEEARKIVNNGIQMNPAQMEESYNRHMNQMLLAKPVDFDLHDAWYQAGFLAFEHVASSELGLPAKDIKELRDKVVIKAPLTYWDFAVVNSLIQNRSPVQLRDICYMDFYDLQILCDGYAKIFNEGHPARHDEAMQSAIKELAPKQGGKNGKLVPIGEA